MKSLAAAALLLVLQGIPPLGPLVGPLLPDSNGTVTGVVRRADTGQIIPDVLVAVAEESESLEKAISHAVPTDRNGRFTIRDVSPGTYTVITQRDGFFSTSAQTVTPVQAGPRVTTFEGQLADIGVLELIPGSAISGRIAGPDGLPLASATVEALRPSYTHGRLTLTSVKSTLTDDLGEYRLFWLPPGAYYVRGQYRVLKPDRPERYQRVFFPGIIEEDAAPSIMVGPGGEVPGVDIRVPTMPLGGFRLSGRVIAAENELEVRVSGIYVVPRDRKVLLAGDETDLFINRALVTAGGQFEIRDVPPGAYDLFPVSRDDDGKLRASHIAINVEDRNIENMSIILDRTLDLHGSVTWNGGSRGERLSKDSILVRPLDGTLTMRADVAINPDPETGEFTLPLTPGKYAVQPASNFPSNAYIADVTRVTREETSVFDAGFTISTGSLEPLSVKLKPQGGSVSGTVIDPTRLRPVAYATVALVPELARRKNLALYRHVRSESDGGFKLTGVAPGYYKLFAWVSVPAGAWENAAFLERFDDRGVSVVVESAADTRLQLNVIR